MHSQRPNRRGYTLLEMLIVVAMVVVVVGLSWPALRRPAEKSKLRDAARQLRVALTRTRIEAIESGTAQEFCYQPGTGSFAISARSTSQDDGGFAPVAFDRSGGEESLAGNPASVEPARQELPGDVRFGDPSEPDAVPVESDPAASPDRQGWSAPIVFYPNGRTFNARIRLYGRYRYYVDVTLRGLTGASKVGQLQRFEEPADESFENPRLEHPIEES